MEQKYRSWYGNVRVDTHNITELMTGIRCYGDYYALTIRNPDCEFGSTRPETDRSRVIYDYRRDANKRLNEIRDDNCSNWPERINDTFEGDAYLIKWIVENVLYKGPALSYYELWDSTGETNDRLFSISYWEQHPGSYYDDLCQKIYEEKLTGEPVFMDMLKPGYDAEISRRNVLIFAVTSTRSPLVLSRFRTVTEETAPQPFSLRNLNQPPAKPKVTQHEVARLALNSRITWEPEITGDKPLRGQAPEQEKDALPTPGESPAPEDPNA